MKYLWQKRPVFVTKETYLHTKETPTTELCRLRITNVCVCWSCRECTVQSVMCHANETSSCLLVMSRPVFVTKEICIRDKRDLFHLRDTWLYVWHDSFAWHMTDYIFATWPTNTNMLRIYNQSCVTQMKQVGLFCHEYRSLLSQIFVMVMSRMYNQSCVTRVRHVYRSLLLQIQFFLS